MIRFSVIVPVYKVEPYIRNCIESILAQSYQNFELILVDDGSPDNSGAICDEYAEKSDKIIVLHKKNGGLASARNAGIDIAKGEYLALVDSDDYVDESFLLSYHNAISTHMIDIVHAGIRYMPSGREVIESFPINQVLSGISMIESAPKIATDISIPFTVRYCFRREFLNENGLRYNESIKYAEDSPFNLYAISKAKSMVCISSITYNYVQRTNSITQTSFKPTMTEDSEYYYIFKKRIMQMLKRSKYEYENDMVKKHIFDWLPTIIKNYSNSPEGFTLKYAKQLLNTGFVQDGVQFLLDNKIYNRKLQYYYYKAIKRKSILVYFFWKYGDIKRVIG